MTNNRPFIKTSWPAIKKHSANGGMLFMHKNGQKEQNGFKKLKIHKNQIIYFKTIFPYDDKKGNEEKKM
ncbi:hypothetical protein FKN04_21135 [Bacillus glycinifermentans]|nr:hypothetical protein [Bacillus glycinifermentans]